LDDDIKRLCHNCIGDAYLKGEMQAQGEVAACSYCDQPGHCYSIEDLADRVETVFTTHYERTSPEPDFFQEMMLKDKESDYEWEREGELVVWAIMSSADMPEDAAQDIQQILADRHGSWDSDMISEETEFSDDSYYEEKSVGEGYWREEWTEFERALKTEARFFSRRAADHLTKLFAGIDHMRTSRGKPLVVDAGPETDMPSVYRARVFQSDARLITALCRPDLHIGSPPARLAAAGRMNASGISVFYGADKPEVAIAEVRPPVGSQVAVARFEIIKPLRILDLSALGTVHERGSYYNPKTAERLERAAFLRSLSQRIRRPVMPDDEGFDYLATQAIADFLATEAGVPLDGILFPSVQAGDGGRNLVLFHKAALVEPLEIPSGTEIEASLETMTDEGWEREYSVVEKPPASEAKEADDSDRDGPPNLASLIRPPPEQYEYDPREPALRIDVKSVEVHVVKRVEFETERHHVYRHRWEHKERKF